MPVLAIDLFLVFATYQNINLHILKTFNMKKYDAVQIVL